MKLIALDTATEACTAALYLDGAIHERHRIAPRRHAELMLADIEALLADAGLKPAQLDGVAFGRGPGSFTGVRIATAITQGLAYGAELPVAPVSTLATLAQGAMRERGAERVIAAFDARLQEVYIGRFTRGADGLAEPADAEAVLPPVEVGVPDEAGWHAAGTGFDAQDGALASRLESVIGELEPDRLPQAHDTALLGAAILGRGAGVPPAQALPVYLREKVAKKPKREGRC